MPSYQRKEIIPGLFVLAAAAVFALFAFRIGRWEVLSFLKGDRVACRVVFDEVKTMVVGAKVVVAGRRVGAVHRLSWTERPYEQADIDKLRQKFDPLPAGVAPGNSRLVVEVDFELTDASLRIDPASASVALQQDGLLGQHFLDLYPGSWPTGKEPPPILEAGHAEPLQLRPRHASGIEDLAANAGDAIAAVDTLLRTLNDGVLSQANRDHLGAMLASLSEAAGELRQLLAGDGAVQTGALRSLQQLLDSANAALAAVRDQTLPRTDLLLEESRQGVQEFRATVAAVQRDLASVLDQLEGVLIDTRPELAESARRLRSTLWQAEMALRKVRANPALLLFGDAEQDLEAREFDESGARASGRARIYQQRDERAGGR